MSRFRLVSFLFLLSFVFPSAWEVSSLPDCKGVFVCVSEQSNQFLDPLRNVIGCLIKDGEVSIDLVGDDALWQYVVLPNNVSTIPLDMWTSVNSSFHYTFALETEDKSVISEVKLLDDFPASGKVKYADNSEKATEFLINGVCASTGVTNILYRFNFTGQMPSGNCETSNEFAIQKSCRVTQTPTSSVTLTPTTPTTATVLVTERKPLEVTTEAVTTDVKRSTSSFLFYIIGACIGVIALGIIVILVIVFKWKRRREQATFDSVDLKLKGKTDRTWEVNPNDIRLDEQIGKGAFSRVYRGEYYSNKSKESTVVAVKCLSGNSHDYQKEMLLKEIELMKNMDYHPNLLGLKGCCTRSPENPIMLLMEYMNMGSLLHFLRKNRILKCDCDEGRECTDNPSVERCSHDKSLQKFLCQCVSFAWQVSNGMKWMEEQHYVHRDLAARNVLLNRREDDNIVAKLSDFGLAKDVYESGYIDGSDEQRPIKWTAPEALIQGRFTIKSDVWSFGILLWEITTLGSVPYPGLERQLLVSMLEKGHRMDQPEDCSEEMYQLMVRCWEARPAARPNFREIKDTMEGILSATKGYLDLSGTS
eukprot:m.133138 g.133138  ORF g.133138 m.133138 type:complete len:589 (+) comp38106_c0_seq6:401-2167(+)